MVEKALQWEAIPLYEPQNLLAEIPPDVTCLFVTLGMIRMLQTLPVDSPLFEHAEHHLQAQGMDTETITMRPRNGGLFPDEPLGVYFDKYGDIEERNGW